MHIRASKTSLDLERKLLSASQFLNCEFVSGKR